MAAKRNADTNPLGDYIRTQRGDMSRREAARRAGISEGRWRQVELGYQQMAGGVKAPVHPKAETVAAMCRAISADIATALKLAGYDPAKNRHLIEGDQGNLGGFDATRREWFAGLSREDREAVLSELQKLHVDVEVKQNRKRAAG